MPKTILTATVDKQLQRTRNIMQYVYQIPQTGTCDYIAKFYLYPGAVLIKPSKANLSILIVHLLRLQFPQISGITYKTEDYKYCFYFC